ncbi:MAG: hypothetical protein ACTHNW_04350 [Mucilaginibacter sp.]
MGNKFFYLYLAGGILAIGLLLKDIINTYPAIPAISDILLDAIPAVLLFYLAFKTYHEKKDKEMM